MSGYRKRTRVNPEDENFDPEELRQLFTGEIPYPKEISFYLDESSVIALDRCGVKASQ